MSRFIFQTLSVLSVFGLVNSVLFYYFVGKESEGGRLQAEMLALKREVKDEKACRSKVMAEGSSGASGEQLPGGTAGEEPEGEEGGAGGCGHKE